MGASATLLKFAKSRESAYLQYGRLDGARARAVSKIRQVADFFSKHSEQVQLRAVTQVEAEIRTLLPSAESRYKKIRNQMITLIAQARYHSHGIHFSRLTPFDEGAEANSAINSGTQLSMF